MIAGTAGQGATLAGSDNRFYEIDGLTDKNHRTGDSGREWRPHKLRLLTGVLRWRTPD
jgi:hypothetical protein